MKETNVFLKGLREIRSKTKQVSMWELSIPVMYEEHALSEEHRVVLQTLTHSLQELFMASMRLEQKK